MLVLVLPASLSHQQGHQCDTLRNIGGHEEGTFGHHLREGPCGQGWGKRKGCWGLAPWNCRQAEPALEVLASGDPGVEEAVCWDLRVLGSRSKDLGVSRKCPSRGTDLEHPKAWTGLKSWVNLGGSKCWDAVGGGGCGGVGGAGKHLFAEAKSQKCVEIWECGVPGPISGTPDAASCPGSGGRGGDFAGLGPIFPGALGRGVGVHAARTEASRSFGGRVRFTRRIFPKAGGVAAGSAPLRPRTTTEPG